MHNFYDSTKIISSESDIDLHLACFPSFLCCLLVSFVLDHSLAFLSTTTTTKQTRLASSSSPSPWLTLVKKRTKMLPMMSQTSTIQLTSSLAGLNLITSPRRRDREMTVMSGAGGGGGGDGMGMDSLVKQLVVPTATSSSGSRNGGDGDGAVGAEFPKVKALFEKTFTQKKNIYSTDPIPLNNPWTFWVDRTARGANMEQYEANLKKIYTVYTVQRFWAVYYNIPKPSDLQPQSSLHMMRDDRKPLWEETYNCRGGTFRLRVQKKDANKVWKELMMAAIGEQLGEFVDEKDEICGVSISMREKEDVLLIWNTNAELAKESRLLECLRQILPDTHFLSTFYKPHVTHHAFEKGPNGKKGPKGKNTNNLRQHAMT